MAEQIPGLEFESPKSGLAHLSNLPVLKQVSLLIGMAASIAVGVAIVMWTQQPGMSLLYGNLDNRELAAIVTQLDQQRVKYEIDSVSGTILVPGEKVHALRISLAGMGYPKGQANGYELLDVEPGFGVSQFQETTRYHRALEGELARSVTSFDAVKSARVHLALPKRSSFLRNAPKPSASVVLSLYNGRGLERGQIEAIVHLVASSVPDLGHKDVSVVDQAGNLLTGRLQDDLNGLTTRQLEYTRQVETSLASRVVSILEPVVGFGKVRAEVAAKLDFTQFEQSSEDFSPEKQSVRSEQLVRELGPDANGARGVPGALTNQPPASGNAPERGVVRGEPTGQAVGAFAGNTKEIRNFELDRSVTHTRKATGEIVRLSLAVLLDDKIIRDGEGKTQRVRHTDEEIQRYTALVQDAVGYDANRGDTVTIVNAAFQEPEEILELEAPIWEQGWFIEIVRQLVALIAILVLFFAVIRPLLRTMLGSTTAEDPKEVEALLPPEFQSSPNGPSQPMKEPELVAADSLDARMEQLQELAETNPEATAQLMRKWMNS
jgi:flagellar M-ring protein FliF